jgi:hypothetical protein
MYQTTPLIVLSGDSQPAITLTMETLASAGLLVVRSFDLQVARATHTHCTCPHHGTDRCNCQLVVLLVYEKDKQPVTLVAHGYDGETQLAFVDHPDQHPDPDLIETIRHTLSYIKTTAKKNLRLNPHAA